MLQSVPGGGNVQQQKPPPFRVGSVNVTEGKEGVLVVRHHDEEQAVTNLLEDMGMVVRHASSGRDAIYLLEDHPFDFLVMDIQLSDMHAWQMLGTLKEIVDLRTLPTLVITNEQTVVPLPNVTLVVRPVSMAKLRSIIDGLFTP